MKANPVHLDQLAENIRISVASDFLQEHSDIDNEQFVFSYTITIENQNDQAVKLLNRRWVITDADGKESVVEGEGVIGKQPTIKAGGSFTYSSGSVFKTPLGYMQGHYQMLDDNANTFWVEIPIFRLALPNILN